MDIEDNEPHFTHFGFLTIKQFGTKIKAKGELNEAENYQRYFDYQGAIKAGQLILTFEEKGGANYNVGTMVLRLGSDMKKMELNGSATFYHKDKYKVVTKNKHFKKI